MFTDTVRSNASSKKGPGSADETRSSGGPSWMIWVIVLVVVLIGGSFLDATSDNSDNTVDKKRRSAQSGESFSPYKIDESKIHTPDPIEVMRKRYNVTILSEEPYLIQFDNFLSDKECEA
eukprot:gene12388-30120_t